MVKYWTVDDYDAVQKGPAVQLSRNLQIARKVPNTLSRPITSMADSLVDLGIQDALRYVNVDIIPSIVTVARDVMMILVTSLTCVSGPPPELSSTSTIRPGTTYL